MYHRVEMDAISGGGTELVESLDRAAALMVAASVEALHTVVACNEAKLWRKDGATSMTAWLAARYNLSRGTAREWVRVGHVLRRLPKIAEAYAEGRLSWDQLRPLTRFATAETDEHWARRAPSMRPAGLYLEARRHERVRTADVQEINSIRSVALWWDTVRPVMYLEGTLPGEQGAAVQAALERRAEEGVLADRPAIPEEARLADALVELVTGSGEGEAAPATLVVHAVAEALTGEERARGPWLAETESGQRLASESVRRLACDARIEWVIEAGDRPVGIGRRGRYVLALIGRLLRHRDRGCRFPGCERRRWLKAHHLVHWARGGATDLDNLVLLCHAHHRLVHEGGWKTRGRVGGSCGFMTQEAVPCDPCPRFAALPRWREVSRNVPAV
jgi:hypothetical protein